MKKITLLLVFVCCYGFAQETEKEEPKAFRFDPVLRFQFFYPVDFGDNALAKAYNPSGGLGTSVSLFTLKGFKPGIGYDYSLYNVSDHSRVGNVSESGYWAFYGFVGYEIPASKTTSFYPDLGVGYAQLTLRAGSPRYGHQEGVQFRAGCVTNYRFTKTFSAFVGVHYIYSQFDIATHSAFEDYYGKAQQLQLAIGIQLD